MNNCNQCGEKPKKNCTAFPKAVVEINNPEKIVLFRKVVVPASMGGRDALPPAIGKYHNVLLEYEADGSLFLYSSDGIPTQLSTDVTDLQRQLDVLGIEIDNERVERVTADEGLYSAIEEEVINRQNADTDLGSQITNLDNSLATVARTGSYNDLSDKPTIGNATLTIKKNGSNVGTFTANATANKNIDISVPTKTSNLVNDGSDGASQYVESDDLATVATSGSYNDLTNKPTIGNATLTIKRNNTNAGTFTANATSNKTINIAVPTKTSDLTNDGSDGTSTYVETKNLPTVGNATLTITENNTPAGTFTANATSNKTINITSPTKTSDLTNDGSDGTSTYVESDDLPTVDTTYSSSSNNAIANSTVTNSLDRNVMTNLTLDSTPSTTTVNLNNTKTNLAHPSSTTTSSISLPVASSTQAGVMNSSTFDAIASNTNNINAILSGAVAITGLPASPTQAELTAAWENETGLTSLMNRAGIYDVTNSKVWTYYTNDNTWYAASNTSQVTVSTFTNSSEGLIKGSTNDGQVFAENDGTGSVNGWDTLTSAVSSNTSKLATIAQGAEVNVQANWTQTNTNADDYIKNKPANLVQDANYVHTDNNFTTALKDKLNGISAGAEVNVQSDWSQTDISADDYIKNKPANLVQDANYVHTDNNFTTTLKNKLDGVESGAEVNVQADWTQTNTNADDYIKNKPANIVQDANYVHTDNNFTTTLKNKLDGISAGAEVNVQADWTQSDTSADDYIKNKPTIPTVNNATLTIQKNGSNVQTFTANSSTNKTANITVPTAVSELTNDANYATTVQLSDGLATKQNTLTAGSNITITNDTISATDTTYTAGDAISIDNGVISANIHPADFFDADEYVSDCGSTMNLSETVDSTIKSIELQGDTQQQTYTGKNLIYTNPKTNLGITASYDASTGVTTISGQATDTYATFNVNNLVLPTGTYTLSTEQPAPVYIGVGIRIDGGTRTPFAVYPNDTSRTFTLPENMVGYDVYISGLTAGTNYNFSFKLQLESGSTATAFEPYVGGAPSPNPDYPQTVNVVTGTQTVTVTGKNLFDKNNVSGGTYYINSIQHKILYGETTYSCYIPIEAGVTYTVSKMITGRFAIATTQELPAPNVDTADDVAGNSSASLTLTASAGAKYLVVYFYRSQSETASIEEIEATIQIEKGSLATTYEPYQGQSYTVDLAGDNLFDISKVISNSPSIINNGDGTLTVTAYGTYASSPNTLSAFCPTLQAGDEVVLIADTTSSNKFVYLAGSNTRWNFGEKRTILASDLTSGVLWYSNNASTPATISNIKVAKPIELCKIGTYQDYIYKSGNDWYIHKATGKRYVTSISSIYSSAGSGYIGAQFDVTDMAPNSRMNGYCNILIPMNSPSGATTEGITFGAGNAYVYVILKSSRMASSTVANWNAWLASNTTTIYYPLATATDTEITDDTLIGQLNALGAMRSYNDQTNIIVTTTSNNLPATLCVTTYRKSLDGVLDLINDTACTCKNRQGNLVVHLPNGMTTYTNNDAPIPISEVLKALERGQSVFLVDGGLYESVYTVTAASMDDGIYSMRADQTGINPRGSDGHWHISGDGGNVWDSVTFVNDATPSTYSPNIYDKTWFTFTSSTPLLDQNRRTYYPASRDVTFNNAYGNLSVAELWEKLASSAWNGNPVILEVPLQEISTRTTNLVDVGFTAENPLLTISVSLGPDSYFERETSEYTITGWAAECTPITFDGKEAYAVGIVRVVGDGNTDYRFVVSLTEVNSIN